MNVRICKECGGQIEIAGFTQDLKKKVLRCESCSICFLKPSNSRLKVGGVERREWHNEKAMPGVPAVIKKMKGGDGP